MRTSMFLLLILSLGACASRPASRASSTDEHSVAANQPASGGEVANACGEAQVFFSSGSSVIDEAAAARLDGYADCLTRHETDVVYIAGMTDPDGTPEDNLVLGRARARAVADHLHAAGCDVDFVIRSAGETDADGRAPLWPLERSATAAAVDVP